MREGRLQRGVKNEEIHVDAPEHRALGQRQAKLMKDALTHSPQAFKEFMVDGSVVCSGCGSIVLKVEDMWPSVCAHCHARM